jgi:hypothetical protein
VLNPRPLAQAALALAAVMCAVPAGASAAELTCGATITEDTDLSADVVCGENETGEHGYALLVAADNVTLDLRDHQVGSDWHQGIGVVGRSGVTIRAYGGLNSYAIHLRDTTDSHIQGVRVLWLYSQGSDRNRITYSQAQISLSDDSDDNVVEHNHAGGEGGGVSLTFGSDRNVVRYNSICGGMGDPLWVENSNDNLIEHNFVPACMGLSGTGMLISSGSGNRLISNSVIGDGRPHDHPDLGPGDGIRVQSPETFLSGNIANNHEGYGINVVEGVESGVNYARGNGNPAQCLNAICVPGGTISPTPAAGAARPSGTEQAPATDRTSPALALAAKKRQRLGKTISVAVSVAEELWASAHGKLTISGGTRSYRLRRAAGRPVGPGEQLTLKVALPRAAQAAARRALGQGRQVEASVTVRVTDAAGNSSAGTRTIRLRR